MNWTQAFRACVKGIPWTLPLLIFLSTIASAQTCVPPPPGIVAWWPFDETAGTIANDVAGEHPGVYFDGPTPVAGQVGGALHFNGSSSFVGAVDSDLWAFGQNDFTIEFWANFDQPGSGSLGHPGDIFIGNDEGPENRNKWFFALGGGFLNFHINSPTLGPRFFPLAPFAPEVHRWYHLALTRNGSLYTISVDGTPAASIVDSNPIPNPASSLTLGQAESLGFMHGLLDEVSIYNRALTEAELKEISTAGNAGKCKAETLSPITVLPSAGGDTGTVTLRITGPAFSSGASVQLSRQAQPDILGQVSTLTNNGKSIISTFDLTGKATGPWDLIITNQGKSTNLPGAFSIEKGRAAQIWTDVVGRGAIRAGQPQEFSILIGNRGNVDLIGSLIWIEGIPLGSDIVAYRWSSQPIPKELVSIETDQSRAVPLFAVGLPPGATELLDLYIKTVTSESFTIIVEAMP